LRVTEPWRATYDPALAVTAGQRIRPGRLDDAFPGWQWVEGQTGLGGWVPAGIVAGETITEAFDTAELSVAPGALLLPLSNRLGWTLCRAEDGSEGWVPDRCPGPA